MSGIKYVESQEDYDLVVYGAILPGESSERPIMAVSLSRGEHGFCRARAILATAIACNSLGHAARDLTVTETHYAFESKDGGGKSHIPLRKGEIVLGRVARMATEAFAPDARPEMLRAIESDDIAESNAAIIALYQTIVDVERSFLGDTAARERAIRDAIEKRNAGGGDSNGQ